MSSMILPRVKRLSNSKILSGKVLTMIRTFIFFDLETTGLIRQNSMPKITEMSLIAVSRNDIVNTEERLPRVLQKLVLPINPKMEIPGRVQDITKLSNDNLREIGSFECQVYELLKNFLSRLAMPYCFVAHNGNAFDYPILLSELSSVNQTFPDEVLSIDSLHLFREFFSVGNDLPQQVNVTVTTPSVPHNPEDIRILLNDGNDDALCAAMDNVMRSYYNDTAAPQSSTSKDSSLSSIEKRIDKSSIESKCANGGAVIASCYEKMQRLNEKTPESRIVKSASTRKHFQDVEGLCARRRLEFARGRLVNYKLPTVYAHIFNRAPDNAHSAEGDCLAMLSCACQLGSYFVEWADRNAKPMSCYQRV